MVRVFDKKMKYKLFGHRSSIEQLTPATASELLRLVGNDERSGSRPIQLTAKLPAQSRGAQKAGKRALKKMFFFFNLQKKYKMATNFTTSKEPKKEKLQFRPALIFVTIEILRSKS